MKVFILALFIAFVSLTAAKNKINYGYTLWIGDNVDEVHSIRLQSFVGIKFIDSMNQAASKDPTFVYEGTDSQYGKFITKIAGQSQDPSK